MHNPKMWEQTSSEFGNVIFDTHQGELGETGILPALFELKRIANRNKNKNDIKLTPTTNSN